ncbi:MAG: lytic transglycosylase domain-containing protein [Mesorhizobium sp.]|nr:lytic transglycosylase domain-containing protein [Mesorhizobium sp.]MCO5164601.1 lytic transglycosylase domain-containing protein [Mesorhizobium sp.]
MDGTTHFRTSTRLGCSTLVLIAVTATAAPAQTRDILALSSTEAAAVHSEPAASADQAFEERWNGGGEFIVGQDGRLTAGTASHAASVGAILHTHKGNVQIGIISNETAPLVQSKECGPSPLSPDQIRMLVEEAATRHGVDPAFAVAVAWAESDFDRNRNSPKGAQGVMQLMPATAERFGVADVCDPADNIEGGIGYLRVLFEQFENPLIVAAAYNAGEARVLEHGGIPPFHETVGFVAKVVNYQLGRSMPSTARSKSDPSSAAGAANSPHSGVITARAHGEFVGGVMHFNWREEK